MAKKKKDYTKGYKQSKVTYNDRDELHGIVSDESYKYLADMNKTTIQKLGPEWEKNFKYNVKHFWDKRKTLRSIKNLKIAKDKVTIGVGAGPSFKKNSDVLVRYLNEDGVLPWPERMFVTISSNHQYKPLLKMGVIPDFVILVDSGAKGVYEQLCVDIPESGKNTVLITGLHCSTKIIEDWTKQGREVLFYITPAPIFMDLFKKLTKKNPLEHKVELGGNTLNGAWMISLTHLASTIFVCVGNDLSFKVKDTVDEQRDSYYADGDYTTNAPKTGSGRDEAQSPKRWGSFSLTKKRIILPNEPLGRYDVNLDIAGVSATLWVYKTWLEITILGQTKQQTRFHYFNCSELGILGVMSRCQNADPLVMRDISNWYMFDEVAINKHTGVPMYHTAMLDDTLPFLIDMRRKYDAEQKQVSYVQPIGESQAGRILQTLS